MENLGSEMINEGRRAIWHTNDLLQRYPDIHGTVFSSLHNYLSRYFDIKQIRKDDSVRYKSSKEFQWIKNTISKTFAGMHKREPVVKVGFIESDPGFVTRGEVVTKGQDSKPRREWKTYNNRVSDMPNPDEFVKTKAFYKVISSAKPKNYYKAGAIKIRDSVFLQDPLSKKLNTYIHENTHKYAGTLDKFYVNYDDLIKGQKREWHRMPAFSKQNARVNADNYSRLVVALWSATVVDDEENLDLTALFN
jgi:hypothetical protein